MAKIAQKKNLSSIQVLKTLSFLLKGDYSMQELIEMLNNEESDSVFNNSVISKYINTCRFCGVEIPKIHNKYFVTHLPFGLELTSIETDLLNQLQNIVAETMSRKSITVFTNFMETLNRFSGRKIAKIEKDDYHTSFEQFERAVTDKRKVKLLFKNRDVLECIPLKVIDQNEKTFFKVYNKRNRMIDVSRLSGIETLNQKFIPINEETINVVYKIKPPMSKRYELRANETQMMTEDDGSIIISNNDENKECLLSRLMRYDTCCEILTPTSYRDDMKQIIEDTLKNYGV